MRLKLTIGLLLGVFIALYMSACTDSVSPGIEESLELYAGLELIDEASNTSVNVNKGNEAYFEINVDNVESNKLVKSGVHEAWCLEWRKPLRSNNDLHSGVEWYSSENNEKWKPLNYFFSIQHKLQQEDEELTYKDIQAVIWTIAGYMNIAPEFNVDKLSDSELPTRLRSNGVADINREKVKVISSKVLSEYNSVDRKIPGGVIGRTSHQEQDIIVPPPPPPVIDVDTKIFIYFDASGSMNSTLAPLNTMRSQLLKTALLPLYENDGDAYDDNVTVTSWSSERTFDVLNLGGATPPDGNVIVLVFQDEAVSNYHRSSGWTINSPKTSIFDSDMSAFRTRLASFPSDYYRGVIFQVTNSDFFGNETQMGTNFRTLIQAIENGDGEYAGANGLSDRTEIEYVYDVNDGDSPQVYTDLVIDALEDFGFDLTPPTP